MRKNSKSFYLMITTAFCLLVLLPSLVTAVQVTGNLNWEMNVNDVKHKISQGRVQVNTKDDMEINHESYKILEVWSFFQFSESLKYKKTNYKAFSTCKRDMAGSTDLSCGSGSCPSSADDTCKMAFYETSGVFGSIYRICYGARTEGVKEYLLYGINDFAHIVRTTYGGPFYADEKPGYTISSTRVANYSYNAVIEKIYSRTDVPISNFRYFESEDAILPVETLHSFSEFPKLEISLDKEACDWNIGLYSKVYGKVSLIETVLNEAKENAKFTPFIILKSPPEPTKLSSLEGKAILGSNGGIEAWKGTAPFNFVDPCNRMFLTLRVDELGNYYVIVPAEGVLSTGDVICIAIQEKDNSKSLFLYEAKNMSKTWTNSTRFSGAVSNDYVRSLDLLITTNSDKGLFFSAKEVRVIVNFETGSDAKKIIKLKSTVPLKCQVVLSTKCTFEMITTEPDKFITRTLETCGFLYQEGTYSCDGGVGGSFVPPSDQVIAPIDNLYKKDTTTVDLEEISGLKDSNGFSFSNIFGGFDFGAILAKIKSSGFFKLIGILLLVVAIGFGVFLVLNIAVQVFVHGKSLKAGGGFAFGLVKKFLQGSDQPQQQAPINMIPSSLQFNPQMQQQMQQHQQMQQNQLLLQSPQYQLPPNQNHVRFAYQ